MRKLLSAVVLCSASIPAFAVLVPVPEPETFALLAVGVAGLLMARRSK